MARAQTRFSLSAKRTIQFKSAEASVQSTTGSRGVRISGSNAGYTTFRGSVKSTGYPLHSPVSPSLPLPCVTVCHHISTGLYIQYQTTVPHSVQTISSVVSQQPTLYDSTLPNIFQTNLIIEGFKASAVKYLMSSSGSLRSE